MQGFATVIFFAFRESYRHRKPHTPNKEVRQFSWLIIPGVLAVVLCLSACGNDKQAVSPEFDIVPQLSRVDAAVSPLTVMVNFSTNKPVKAHYHLQTKASDRQLVTDSFQRVHRQALLNFKAGALYTIVITIEDKEGNKTVWPEPLEFSAPDLSDDFPVVKSVAREGKASAVDHGLTALNLFRYRVVQTPDGIDYVERDSSASLLLVVDSDFDPVWFFVADKRIDAIQQDTPTTLTLIGAHGRETINFLGRSKQVLQGERQLAPLHPVANRLTVNSDSLHGKQLELGNGNRLLLSTEMRIFDSYPRPPLNPAEAASIQPITDFIVNKKTAAAMLVGDQLIEIDRHGTVVKRWPLFDLLDGQRQSYVSHLPDPKAIYPPNSQLGLPQAWSQANGIAYKPATDTLLVSVKNQEAIVGIGKTSGQLKWILGDPAGWRAPWSNKLLRPVKSANSEAFVWPYQPSSLGVNAAGDILLLDNGGYQSVPPSPPLPLNQRKPRVRVLSVDEQAMTVTDAATYPLDVGDTVPRSIDQQWLDWPSSSMTVSADSKALLVADSLSARLSQIELAAARSTALATLTARPGSDYRWGIADIIHLPQITAAPDDQFPASLRSIPPYASPQIDSESSKTFKDTANVYGGLANTHVPTVDISGPWELNIGGDPAQQLKLSQNGQLVSGELGGFPVIAWVKGNTFSMTLRRNNGIGQVRFRYRGVINDDADQMQGQVIFETEDKPVASWRWTADRS